MLIICSWFSINHVLCLCFEQRLIGSRNSNGMGFTATLLHLKLFLASWLFRLQKEPGEDELNFFSTECYIVFCFVKNQKWGAVPFSVILAMFVLYPRKAEAIACFVCSSTVCDTAWRPCSSNRSILLASCKLAVRVWDVKVFQNRKCS